MAVDDLVIWRLPTTAITNNGSFILSQNYRPLEVADIFKIYGQKFAAQYPQGDHNSHLINLIQICRTSKLGGHLQVCGQCDYQKPVYNSCRSRMCPKCQGLKKERWVEKRKKEILPCEYFHGVFTLPHELNALAMANKKLIYNLLFQSVAQTLQYFGKNELKGQLGFISVLHTWNQKLQYHIHLHCIIPAGALRSDVRWAQVKHRDFLFPVLAMSKVFKTNFIAALRENFQELELTADNAQLDHPGQFNNFLYSLWDKAWVVYAKRPFNGPEAVINYLGRYTHRVAISNARIIKHEAGRVHFKYRDRTDNDQEKILELDALEFLRRFMLHALPKGFQRIRYYGFLCNRRKNKNIDLIYADLNIEQQQVEVKEITAAEFFLRVFKIDIHQCPQCKSKSFQSISIHHDRPP